MGVLIKATLQCVGYSDKGTMFSVAVNGETIIRGAVDPEYTAMRFLAKSGRRGDIQFYHKTGTRGLYFPDLVVAAKYRTVEDDRGLSRKKHTEFTQAKRDALSGKRDAQKRRDALTVA